MFERKDNRIKALEKRIEGLEKHVDEEVNELKKRTKEQVKDIGDSLKVLEGVMSKMQDERDKMKQDRNFMLEKEKELIRQIPIDRTKLKRSIREKLLLPLHHRVKEHAELIKKAVAVEGVVNGKRASKEDYIKNIKSAIVSEETKTPIDKLFELVMNKGNVKIADAARNFAVSEEQLEEWAKILEEHGLIEIHYPPIGKPELRKKVQEK